MDTTPQMPTFEHDNWPIVFSPDVNPAFVKEIVTDGNLVLVYCTYRVYLGFEYENRYRLLGPKWVVGYYDDVNHVWRDSQDCNMDTVYCWMPLPPVLLIPEFLFNF